jgi:excisionase family DNA binding protein
LTYTLQLTGHAGPAPSLRPGRVSLARVSLARVSLGQVLRVRKRVPPAQVDPTWVAPGTAPRVATTPTTADLHALHGGRDRLLTVREAADQLRIGAWAIYRFCETRELSHIRITESIRIRPADLAAFAEVRRVVAGRKRPSGPTEQP